VLRELAALESAWSRSVRPCEELAALAEELADVNRGLWRVEDELRQSERAGNFNARFIELARSVYRNNDQRSELKRRIDLLLGSKVTEEKVYRVV
jgi:hypothetical protein